MTEWNNTRCVICDKHDIPNIDLETRKSLSQLEILDCECPCECHYMEEAK